jgi:pimeloyl-ACP methyl ester carboxylesterase
MEWLSLANRVIRRTLIASGVSSEVVRLRGADVHFYRAEGRATGNAPPLMLVHGLGSSANAFFRTLAPLAKSFGSVFAVDLPGNGFSPVPGGGPMPVREQVELLLEFRQRIIGEPVFLLGNSLGGGMSLNMAFQDPGALRALGLVSPAGAQITEERFAQLLASFQVQDAAGARVLAHKLFVKPPLSLLLFADELRKMMSSETVKSIVATISPSDLVQAAQLSALPMPTLLIWGQSEKLLPYEGLDFFRAHLPAHAEIHEVKGFGHMPQMEHPRAFVERIQKFAVSRGLVQASALT